MKFSFINTLLLSVASFTVSAAQSVNHSSPADPGVINQEQILYWLEKRGELAPNADVETRKLALERYINKKSFDRKELPGVMGKQVLKAESFIEEGNQLNAKKLNKNRTSIQSAVAQNEVETTVKVLAIMIDFPDLNHGDNGLTPSDTAMYYSNYSVQHYNDLLFSETGYEGPSGQTIISGYQYYQQESGGTFFFTGQANGWVTADNNAKHYGENDADNNDGDMNVPALVLEAVTKAVRKYSIDLAEYDQQDPYDLNSNGIIDEPDGIIDHVMIFHSSIGEEAGGGVLAEDAIWSHRFYVFGDDNQPVAVPDSDFKLYGYTINPIDAATGVTVHEFGHDLGLPDEYDTDNGALGSPVASWSVMASGSWLGYPGGTSPATFSPYARDYLSTRYQGNWINQQEVEFSSLTQETINLVAANNHQDGINQVKVNIPSPVINIGPPLFGEYQYYSGKDAMLNSRLAFDVALPSETATLTMTARWSIETDWDYVQVLVNGSAISGSHTKAVNDVRSTVTNYISGDSADLADAYGALSWVDLSFDLSQYAGENVTIELRYKTDEYELGYGFVADNVLIKAGDSELFYSGGEYTNEVQLNGFSRVGEQAVGKSRNYYIQLRDYSGTDAKLENIGYEPGVLLWYRDQNVSDNKVNSHPGEVFIGVVDADQHLIKSGDSIRGTSTQIRDAAFSLSDQSPRNGDSHLTNNAFFSDVDDYSSPLQPESGIKLPYLGLAMEVATQSDNSSNATIKLKDAKFSVVIKGLSVTLSINDEDLPSTNEVKWLMGDGTELTGQTITHHYESSGEKLVIVSYLNSSDDLITLEKQFIVAENITGSISASVSNDSVTFSTVLTGGYGEFSYRWDFGDGEQSTAVSPTHAYKQSGSYNVQLTLTDEIQQRLILTTSVEVVVPINVVINPTTNNLTANFQSTVSGGDSNYSYQWDFGDGNTATTASPSHTYSQGGSYTVTLSVTDGQGVTQQASTNISVSKAIVTPPKSTPKSSSGGTFGIFALLSMLLVLMRRSIKA